MVPFAALATNPLVDGRNMQKLRRFGSSEVNVMRRIVWLPWSFFRRKPWEDPQVFAQGSCPQSTFFLGPEAIHLSLLHEVFVDIHVIFLRTVVSNLGQASFQNTAIFFFQCRIAVPVRSGSCQRLNRRELPGLA